LASKGLVVPFKFTPAFAVTKPAALDFTFEVSTQFVPFHRKVLSVAVPAGKRLTVFQTGVFPAPALINTCPDVPAEPLASNGLFAPLRFTPAFAVTKPAALDFTFEVSTQFVPFQRNVLSVAVPFATPPDEAIVKVPAPAVNVILAPAVSVDQDGVDPAPPLVRN